MGKLSNQHAANGWTDELVIDYTDFSEDNAGTLADNATKTFTYAVPAGAIVTDVAASLRTAFDDSGAGDELDVTVGDGSDADGYLTAADLHTDQTEISTVWNTGAYVVGGSGAKGKAYTAADTIDILFTPNISTGTDYSLNELNAGEIVFKFRIVEVDSLA